MVMCFAPDCNHYNNRNDCKFFRYPTDTKLRKEWIENTRRKDKVPTINDFLCQCHFKDGKKENGPTIFKYNEDKLISFTSPEKRTKKGKTSSAEGSLQSSETVSSTSAAALPSVEEIELDMMKNEIQKVKEEVTLLRRPNFGFFAVEDDAKAISFYTGLPNKDIFLMVLDLCEKSLCTYFEGWSVVLISKKDQLFLTLIKLKRNFGYFDLSLRFNISESTVSNIFLTWLHCLFEILYVPLMNKVPSQLKNEMCLPKCSQNFRNCRMVVDCTEFVVVRPKKMQHQRLFYSSSKHCHTMKGLIGVAPNGVITYVSDLYPGSTSDKEVFKCSGIADIFETGDVVVADKGFLISDLVPDGVTVNIPTPSQVSDTRARIHVERAIRRIKTFKIMKAIPRPLFPYASKICKVCVCLTNFHPPL